MNLVESLNALKDFRRKQGQRFSLDSMLLIIIMGIMSGKYAYREIASFAKANKKDLRKYLKIKHRAMPSHVTIREVIINLDFNSLNSLFCKWALDYVPIKKKEWVSIDGKAIRSTVTDYDKEYQNFVCLVSVFSQKRGQVIKTDCFQSKKTSEITVVQQLLETLDLKDMVITLDALHCKKNSKTDNRESE